MQKNRTTVETHPFSLTSYPLLVIYPTSQPLLPIVIYSTMEAISFQDINK